MEKQASVFRPRSATSMCLLIGCAAFAILGSSKRAVAQAAESEVLSGDNNVENERSFELLGKTFEFSRTILSSGGMGRSIQDNPDPTPDFKLAFAGGALSKEVRIFSETSDLLSWNTGGNRSTTASGGSFDLRIFPGAEEQQTISATAPYLQEFYLHASKSISISPKFTLEYDFKDKWGIGKQAVEFQLDATVVVTERASGTMSVGLPVDGVSLKGNLKTSTSTTLDRTVKLLKVGAFGFKAEPKVVGEGKIDFGRADYAVDANANYGALVGSATSDIRDMDLQIGG